MTEIARGMGNVHKLTGMDAVRDRMPLARLARQIGITRGAVAQWERVPAERLREVSDVTGIAMDVLRPDLFAPAHDRLVEGFTDQ